MITEAQGEVCDRYGARPLPTPDDLKVGIARGGEGPIHGLRHAPEGDTSGWYIWRGELSDADDFFSPLHAEHLVDELPEVVPFLALPPGWRFLLASDYEDVWYDQTLLDIGDADDVFVSADEMGRSRLHYAALENDLGEAAARLDRGDAATQPDHQGSTPLHLAAQENSIEVARLLLQRGALVDARNGSGNTPLFVAVFNSRGRGEMIQLLRAHGADPWKRNDAGQSPVELARLIGNYDVAQHFADLPPTGPD